MSRFDLNDPKDLSGEQLKAGFIERHQPGTAADCEMRAFFPSAVQREIARSHMGGGKSIEWHINIDGKQRTYFGFVFSKAKLSSFGNHLPIIETGSDSARRTALARQVILGGVVPSANGAEAAPAPKLGLLDLFRLHHPDAAAIIAGEGWHLRSSSDESTVILPTESLPLVSEALSIAAPKAVITRQTIPAGEKHATYHGLASSHPAFQNLIRYLVPAERTSVGPVPGMASLAQHDGVAAELAMEVETNATLHELLRDKTYFLKPERPNGSERLASLLIFVDSTDAERCLTELQRIPEFQNARMADAKALPQTDFPKIDLSACDPRGVALLPDFSAPECPRVSSVFSGLLGRIRKENADHPACEAAAQVWRR